jgi:hypothetical protein
MKKIKLTILFICITAVFAPCAFTQPNAAIENNRITIAGFPLKASLINNNQAYITWSGATGISNYGFDVERMDASGNWRKIGYVKAGTIEGAVSMYDYTDPSPFNGKNYYRLKYAGADGTFNYSENVLVELHKSMLGYTFQNYPNPFTTTTTIRYEVLTKGQVRVAVFDLQGTQLELLSNRLEEPGIHTVQWNGFGNKPGTYLYKIITNDDIITQKMVKN